MDLKFLLGVVVVSAMIAMTVACWLCYDMYLEGKAHKTNSKKVGRAYEEVSERVAKKLESHNAIHYSDLINIVHMAGTMAGGVDIKLVKVMEQGRFDIIMELGEIKSNYSILPTVVEFNLPHLQESV